ncbi:MAG: response regulator [Verrucomicrobia bacterium]|nr:response regulator [Verrucomicrobiota bacterium]
MNQSFLISVVDDDEAVRKTLQSLLKSLGFRVSLYSRAEDFFLALPQAAPNCLILDVRLEGMSGPDLQRELLGAEYSIPIVFITANATEAVQRRAMADGAIDFLMKPFSEDDLLAAIRKALHPMP